MDLTLRLVLLHPRAHHHRVLNVRTETSKFQSSYLDRGDGERVDKEVQGKEIFYCLDVEFVLLP